MKTGTTRWILYTSLSITALAIASWSQWGSIRARLASDDWWMVPRALLSLAAIFTLFVWWCELAGRVVVAAKRSVLPNYRAMLAGAVNSSIHSVREVEKVLIEFLLWIVVAVKYFASHEQALGRYAAAFTMVLAFGKVLNAAGVTGAELHEFDTGWTPGQLVRRGMAIGSALALVVLFTARLTLAPTLNAFGVVLVSGLVAIGATAIATITLVVATTFRQLGRRYIELIRRSQTGTTISTDPQH